MRFVASLFAIVLAFQSTLGAQPPAVVPAPNGTLPVGKRILEWTDASRAEVVPMARRDAKNMLRLQPTTGPRRYTVHLWYPAAANGPPSTRAPYNASALAFTGAFRDTVRLAHYRQTQTHATRDALPLRGPFPLLIFSPDSGLFVEDYTTLLQDIASYGFVVAAVGHPGINLLAFDDGVVGTEWPTWKGPRELTRSFDRDSLQVAWKFFASRDHYLSLDIHHAVSRLLSDTSPLVGIIDTARVGVFGHAVGGAIAAAVVDGSVRSPVRALAVFDAQLPGALFDAPIRVPFMLVRTGAPGYPPFWTARQTDLFGHLENDGYDVLLTAGTADGFTDRPLMTNSATRAAAANARQLATTAFYTQAFFTKYLGDATPSNPPLGSAPAGNSPPINTIPARSPLDPAVARPGVQITSHPRKP